MASPHIDPSSLAPDDPNRLLHEQLQALVCTCGHRAMEHDGARCMVCSCRECSTIAERNLIVAGYCRRPPT